MKAKEGEKKARKRYSAEFKEQELKRAEKEGVAAAARDSGLAESKSTAGGSGTDWRG